MLEQPPQFDAESRRHITDADAEVMTPATEFARMATRRQHGCTQPFRRAAVERRRMNEMF
jgi:hypothetical protein